MLIKDPGYPDDKHWSKTKLIKEAKISTNAMAKMGKGQDVRVEILVKICNVLNCTFYDIIEIIPDAGIYKTDEIKDWAINDYIQQIKSRF